MRSRPVGRTPALALGENDGGSPPRAVGDPKSVGGKPGALDGDVEAIRKGAMV